MRGTRRLLHPPQAPKGGQWHRAVEGTFADYVVMKPGDNVVFRKRTITGIGEPVNLAGSCRFANFPGASQPKAVAYDWSREFARRLRTREPEPPMDMRIPSGALLLQAGH